MLQLLPCPGFPFTYYVAERYKALSTHLVEWYLLLYSILSETAGGVQLSLVRCEGNTWDICFSPLQRHEDGGSATFVFTHVFLHKLI